MIEIKEYVNRKNEDLSLLIEKKKGFFIVDFLIKDKIQKTEYIEDLNTIPNIKDYKFKQNI